MKSLKKNQVVIFVIALMLVAAGYLNYTANNMDNVSIPTSLNANSIDYAGIGDAKLVSSNNVEETNQVENNANEIKDTVQSNSTEIKNENIVTTNSTEIENNTYFDTSRLEREKMYSQMLESYQKILESSIISEEQKSIAQTEVKNINNTKNSIMICENLIKTKGIEDLIIFVNDKSVSIIVKNKKLTEEQIAQIQNIVSRELKVEIDNIHISSK